MTTLKSQDDAIKECLKNELGGYIHDQVMDSFSIDYSPLIDMISRAFDPEQVFSDDQLATWAEHNGWVRDI